MQFFFAEVVKICVKLPSQARLLLEYEPGITIVLVVLTQPLVDKPHNRKPDQLTHPLYLSQTQYKAPAAPFIRVGNT